MKLIILDHFRRWWWVWLLGGLIHVSISIGLCIPHQNQAAGAFPLGVFLGAFLLMMDVQRGHTRVLLTRPVTSKQVARAWWWIAVGIPAAALALLTGITFGIMCLITSLSHHQMPVIDVAANNWMANLFLLGITFFAATGMPAAQNAAAGWTQKLRGAFFGILYGGSIGGWMLYKDIKFATPVGLVIFFIATLLTILGWFRAETLVMERAGVRASSPAPGKKRSAPSRCAEGHGGLLFLCETIFVRMTLMGLFMFGVFILTFALILHGILIPTVGHDATKNVLSGNPTMFTFQFWWVMSFQVVQYAYHLRFLRSLPVSAAKLAGVLVFTPLLAMITTLYAANLLLAAATQSPPFPLERLFSMGFFLQISLASAVMPLLVWRGLDRLSYFLMIVVMMAGVFSAIFFKIGLPAPLSLAISLLTPVVSFLLTTLLLDRSSAIYRPRTMVLGGWQMGAGR